MAEEHCEHHGDCWTVCGCGRGSYCDNDYSSCYNCFLDRRADHVECVYCGRWHSPEFDTCFQCRPQGRDEAAKDLKRVIFTRDSHRCRYCGISEGDLQLDPRLVRPKCAPSCAMQHAHKRACQPECSKRHQHKKSGDHGLCGPGCATPHVHIIADDDGIRPATLHIDHIRPCRHDGTADPWNLQVLCGVCNISKGSDWWEGSRHWQARRTVMSAYLTYLWDFLDGDQQDSLIADAVYDELHWHEAVKLIWHDYASRVKRARPRPEPQASVIPEELPDWAAEYDDLFPIR